MSIVKQRVTRRAALGALTLVATPAAAVTERAPTRKVATGRPDPSPAASDAPPDLPEPSKWPALANGGDMSTALRLVHPLRAGSSLCGWKVAGVIPLLDGACGLLMEDELGRRFQLDICARDSSASAPLPPGRSQLFDVFVANGGTGDRGTEESHGRCAMTVARIVGRNELRVDHLSFSTLRERAAGRARILCMT